MDRTGAKNIVDRKVTANIWDRINNGNCPGRTQVRRLWMCGDRILYSPAELL